MKQVSELLKKGTPEAQDQIKDIAKENKKDIDEIPEKYRTGVEFHYVENIQEVWDFALTDELVKNPVDLSIKEKNDVQDTAKRPE